MNKIKKCYDCLINGNWLVKLYEITSGREKGRIYCEDCKRQRELSYAMDRLNKGVK